MNSRDAALIASVVAVWGINFFFMKIALDELPPMLLGMLRFLLVLFPAVWWVKRPQTAWTWLVLYGLSISFGQFALMFTALDLGLPTGLAALLVQVQVFFTVLVSAVFFREPVCLQHLWGMAAAAVGLLLIGVGHYQGTLPLSALLAVLGAGASWAVGNITVKHIGRVSPLALVVWGSVSAFAAFAAASLYLYGGSGIVNHIGNLSIKGVAGVVFLAYCSSLIGYTAWGSVLSRHPAGKVTPFALLVPVFALVVGYVVLNERLGIWHWAGMGIVMAGLALHIFGIPSRRKRQ
ncbi:EamA family transporter [Neisseria animalis]|nr:EamA family transporter [Neisseria animalis]VEE08769.1 Probable amino-acid metabolite efflux pump [Neisseria animalis]